MKGSLDVTIKLLSCNLVVMSSSYRNNLLQYRIRLHIIDFFPGLYINGSFVHQTIFFLLFFMCIKEYHSCKIENCARCYICTFYIHKPEKKVNPNFLLWQEFSTVCTTNGSRNFRKIKFKAFAKLFMFNSEIYKFQLFSW